jgi:hypothetical protein
MSRMGVVLDRIRERRVRDGYHEALEPRERIPPDLVQPCARYPMTACICLLAAVGAVIASIIVLVVMLVTAGSAPKPVAKAKAAPAATPNVSPRR